MGNDADVLLHYARARLHREEPDGRHLNESLAAFKRYLAIKPDDKAVLRETLEPYLSRMVAMPSGSAPGDTDRLPY